MIAKRYIQFLFGAIAILAMTLSGHAQTIPGHWHKVALPQPSRIGNDNTTDFSFFDSLRGICLSDYGLISSTSNGGQNWSLDTNFGYVGSKNNLNSLECTAPHRGFYHSDAATLSIAPDGCNLFYPPDNNEVNLGDYTTLAEKMYDKSYGFRLVQLSVVRDTNPNNVRVIVTHDGWHSSLEYSSGSLNGRGLMIGYVVDSNDVWAADGGSFDVTKMRIYHSINGAKTWDTTVITGDNQTRIENFCVNPKTREVFFYNNLLPIDYAYSSDYGTTWRLDSTFGIHLYRMANPAPGILWAMIGQSGPGWIGEDVEIFPPGDVQNAPNDYSRKLAYSSDNGKTWLIDSTTFIDDSLEELHFLDARHGWVASWSHDSLFMWYYDPDGNAEVVEHSRQPTSLISAVYPNPVSETISLNAPGLTGLVSVFDVLGREVRRASVPPSGLIQIDAASLPTGAYYIMVGGVPTRFVKE